MSFFRIRILLIFICVVQFAAAQNRGKIIWTADGSSYNKVKDGNIIQVDPVTEEETIVVSKASRAVQVGDEYEVKTENKRWVIKVTDRKSVV